jgi:threonine dehydrogenase-like Zn-dependent dehydrogenase
LPRRGSRSTGSAPGPHRDAHTALITGAGPVGLLAALLAPQRGYDTHVLDRVTDGPKPGLVADLGATYHHGPLNDACDPADVIVECTGVGTLVLDAIAHTAPAGIVCFAGLSSGAHTIDLDPAALKLPSTSKASSPIPAIGRGPGPLGSAT